MRKDAAMNKQHQTEKFLPTNVVNLYTFAPWARSSFRWSKKMQIFNRAYILVQIQPSCGTKNPFNRQNSNQIQPLSSCVFIGDKTVTTDGNPMPPVQCQYSIECTRGIGFPSVVTVSSPIKTQDYTHVFFLLS